MFVNIILNVSNVLSPQTKLMMECVQALRQFIRVAVRAKAPTPVSYLKDHDNINTGCSRIDYRSLPILLSLTIAI